MGDDGVDAFFIHPSHDPRNKATFIDPSMWCITLGDLFYFEKEVEKLWKAGGIPDDRGDNSTHWDRDFGPSIYQVNKYYIQPSTKRSGLGWALQQRPQGCGPCDVFATHCWAEGIFEFCSKVRRTWPKGGRYLWVCFLANPQNGDISIALGSDANKSPFALALKTAKHMIIIPNAKESIYRRLWCVYEAYEGMKLARKGRLMISLPWLADPRDVVKAAIPGVVVAIAGFFFSDAILPDGLGDLFGPGMWLFATFGVCTLVSSVLHYMLHQFCEVETAAIWLIGWCYVELFLVGVAVDQSFWTLCHPFKKVIATALIPDEAGSVVMNLVKQRVGKVHVLRFEQGEDLVVNILYVCITAVYMNVIYRQLIHDEIEKEAQQIAFTTVREATCSCIIDEAAIRAEMEGSYDDVDDTINELRIIGRFDAAVMQNLDLGMSNERARNGFRIARCCLALCSWEFWWLSDLGCRHLYSLLFLVFGASCIVATIITYHVGDRAIHAIEMAMWFGLMFALLSNSYHFFTYEAVGSCSMSAVTLPLQLILFLVMCVADLIFYTGAYGILFRKVQVIFLKARSKMVWSSSVGSSSDDSSDSSA